MTHSIMRMGGDILADKELYESLLLELRRGTLVLSVLSQLSSPKYGYVLVQQLCEKGITVDAGTLYPLLRRLESQGLLTSEWETTGAKPRKYYSRNGYGTELYHKLRASWMEINSGMNQLFTEGESDHVGE